MLKRSIDRKRHRLLSAQRLACMALASFASSFSTVFFIPQVSKPRFALCTVQIRPKPSSQRPLNPFALLSFDVLDNAPKLVARRHFNLTVCLGLFNHDAVARAEHEQLKEKRSGRATGSLCARGIGS
jgi:hypothetical protein